MKRLILIIAFAITALSAFSMTGDLPRKSFLINDNWFFKMNFDEIYSKGQRVDLPHTWNAQDALTGDRGYRRGVGSYTKKIMIPEKWRGERLFIRFEGASTVTNLFVNHRHVGEHRGGYGAFVFELTDYVEYGKENILFVKVNNGEQLDIMPMSGDFNFYGGIYRDVYLMLTSPTCISPLDYASPGVYLVQKSVSDKRADVTARVVVSESKQQSGKVEVRVEVKDGEKVIAKERKGYSGDSNGVVELPLTISKPRLWNGREDPFMYNVVISLYADGKLCDRIEQPLGLRYYRIDAQKGFFLNGKHLQLRGVCRHQDRSEIASALHPMHHDQDAEIMLEMGVNAARLAHYPQATYFYSLMDKYGIITWAEIPFVGGVGFVNQQSFKDNGMEQLTELIRQHYNHPSICFWGLFNELEMEDGLMPYLHQLNDLAHKEDSTRPTVAASHIDGDLNFVADAMAWNKYLGWYNGMPADLGRWLDGMHSAYPATKIAISEYGAGASIYHQQDSLVKSVPVSWWHPENWQTYYHIQNWKVLNERPFVWGSFIWNMFDFSAAHRREGDRPGINDKGLVTYDRTIRKDAFYFYKANWNRSEPFIHLTGKRNSLRTSEKQEIMAFTTSTSAELFVNGVSLGVKETDKYATVVWPEVKLSDGENTIKVISSDGREDGAVITFQQL